MPSNRRHILSLEPDALAAWMSAGGEPPYRVDQVLRWLYVELVAGFDEMTNLPAGLRAKLGDAFAFDLPAVMNRAASSDGSTEKFLLRLADGESIESVAMEEAGRPTFCISSQVGCALGCAFCATGLSGLQRDLSTAEILGQVFVLARALGALRNIVFMGMGEPLLNLDAVLPALAALVDERRFGLGARRITISTAGIVPGIRALASDDVRPNLALSLNSPFDNQRAELMSVARRYHLRDVLDACRDYASASGRRLLIEYVLVGDVNTSRAAAEALVGIATGLGAAVNLIAMNTVQGSRLRKPVREEIERFRGLLQTRGVTVTQRVRRGTDIAAGCGQLRGKHRGQ